MTHRASGHFDVKLLPLPADADRPASAMARRSNDKQFHGDLEGSSVGQMLMIGTAVSGSAAYVSIEVVTGKLHGRQGSFALQHNGVMTRGDGVLTITVVPDSGTDELLGLAGTLDIKIIDGRHLYDLAYTLESVPPTE